MIFIVFLFAGIWVYIQFDDSIWATWLVVGLTFLTSLIINGFSIALLFGTALIGLLVFGYFSLLDYLYRSKWYWPAMILGVLVITSMIWAI